MNFSFTSKLKVENKIRKKTCYIYCCIINNAPSEQILVGFLICHLQVSDIFSTHTVQNGYNHPNESPDKSLEQVYKTHRMTYIRKVRPLLEDALLQFSAHCTFIFHYSFDKEAAVLQDWSITTGSTSIFSTKCFQAKRSRTKEKTNNQTLSVACGSQPGIITKSVFLREGKAKTKNPQFMACFQSLRRVATQTRQRVLGLRQWLLQSVPQGLRVPPSFSNHFYFK